MSVNLITCEEYLSPPARLARNRERRQELRKMMRLLVGYIDVLTPDDERLLSAMQAEYLRLGKERLPLVRQALGVWPATPPA